MKSHLSDSLSLRKSYCFRLISRTDGIAFIEAIAFERDKKNNRKCQMQTFDSRFRHVRDMNHCNFSGDPENMNILEVETKSKRER